VCLCPAERLGWACRSRAMAGVLPAATLEARLDENGTDILAAATAAGYGAASTQARARATCHQTCLHMRPTGSELRQIQPGHVCYDDGGGTNVSVHVHNLLHVDFECYLDMQAAVRSMYSSWMAT